MISSSELEAGSGGAYSFTAEVRRAAPCWLTAAAVLYLTVPVVIFLLGWLKMLWALIAVGCVVAAMWPMLMLKRSRSAEPAERRAWPWWQGATLLVVVALVTATQGVGGLGIQNWDWLKHNAILRDLIVRDWPVVYDQLKQPAALIYYVAYYLPAGLAGKAWGWEAANGVLYVWTVAGWSLAGLWLLTLSGGRWWLCLACLVCFSGWDLVAAMIVQPEAWHGNFDAEWWSSLWTLPSNLTLMAYAPHQALPGWLFTALLMNALERGGKVPPLGGIAALSLLWSPFITIGLGLLYVFFGGVRWSWWRDSLRSQWHLANLAAALVLGILVLYFLARYEAVRLPPSLTSPAKAMHWGEFYVTPLRAGFGRFFTVYFRSTLLEYGLLAGALLVWYRTKAGPERRWILAACLLLILLPWVHYGHYNDLVMRVCIPPLFVLQVVALRMFPRNGPVVGPGGGRGVRLLVLAILAVGVLYPLNMLRITFLRLEERSWLWAYVPSVDRVPDLFLQQRQSREHFPFINQYIGSPRALFFEHFAKPLPKRSEGVKVTVPAPQPPDQHQDHGKAQ